MKYIQNYSELDSCVSSTNLVPNEKTKYTKVIDLNPNGHDCKVKFSDKEIIQKCQSAHSLFKGPLIHKFLNSRSIAQNSHDTSALFSLIRLLAQFARLALISYMLVTCGN